MIERLETTVEVAPRSPAEQTFNLAEWIRSVDPKLREDLILKTEEVVLRAWVEQEISGQQDPFYRVFQMHDEIDEWVTGQNRRDRLHPLLDDVFLEVVEEMEAEGKESPPTATQPTAVSLTSVEKPECKKRKKSNGKGGNEPENNGNGNKKRRDKNLSGLPEDELRRYAERRNLQKLARWSQRKGKIKDRNKLVR